VKHLQGWVSSASPEAIMTRTVDFFDTRTRNWRAHLAISTDVMRELSRISDPQEMYRVFARRMNQLYPTDRQITLSRRGVESPHVRITRFNLWTDPGNTTDHWMRYPVVESELFADLLYANEPRLIDDLHVSPDDPASEFLEGQRSLLAIPIFDHGEAMHTVLLSREDIAAFAPEQVPELVWMSNLFGRAMQTQVLSRALQETVRDAEEEIAAIAALQQSLLPTATPRMPQLDIAAHYRNANRAGGDYYDFFEHPDGSLGVMIADVSGHGTPAAVLMAITHSIAHAAHAPSHEPGAFLSHINRHLAGRYNRDSGSFVTAFYAVIDPSAGRITYASAGHVPPRHRKADGSIVGLNRVQRLPLGIHPAADLYPQATTAFGPGETVLLYTDGVSEAMNPAGQVFGIDRFNMILDRGVDLAADLLVRFLAEIDRFSESLPQADDRTVVVIHHQP
jgi:phosphoserine phosphatase RsbU/P